MFLLKKSVQNVIKNVTLNKIINSIRLIINDLILFISKKYCHILKTHENIIDKNSIIFVLEKK